MYKDSIDILPDSDDITGGVILQLNPSILVETPLGRGHALFLIDYGIDQNSYWIVALEKNGTVKHFNCSDILISNNSTYYINTDHNTNQFEP